MPTASVIINSYRNENPHLIAAIQSCLDQKGVDMQVIVSTVKGDPAIDVSRDMGVDLVVSDRPGIYSQLNKALPSVTGDWFFCFSGNDVALVDKVSNELKLCKDGKLICYSAYYYADHDLNIKGIAEFHDYDRAKHLLGNFMVDDALMPRSILRRYAPFREEFGNYAYWDFWLRISSVDPTIFVYSPKPAFLYRLSPTSRHIRKKRDPAMKAMDDSHRDAMLASHRTQS